MQNKKSSLNDIVSISGLVKGIVFSEEQYQLNINISEDMAIIEKMKVRDRNDSRERFSLEYALEILEH